MVRVCSLDPSAAAAGRGLLEGRVLLAQGWWRVTGRGRGSGKVILEEAYTNAVVPNGQKRAEPDSFIQSVLSLLLRTLLHQTLFLAS